jgi:hypothetical protein
MKQDTMLSKRTANEAKIRCSANVPPMKQEYDAVRVKVGSLSQQTFNDMYQPNQGSPAPARAVQFRRALLVGIVRLNGGFFLSHVCFCGVLCC